MTEDITIGVIGLGYVGLPLAIEFGKTYKVIGYDTNERRVKELESGIDITKEVDPSEIKSAKHCTFSFTPDDLLDCNFYIVTVPTPIDRNKLPDLNPLRQASETIATNLHKDNIVVYESTVYPGATEEFCVPILEEISGLKFNEDFSVGYSPERINPGDKAHRLTNIIKVISGSNKRATQQIQILYNTIIKAGTYVAENIKVAEAAKVIENTQRDINIALMNELSIIFDKLEIDTDSVLKAAGTKWNFLKFKPGLVGGHCIGVDPYYLTYKSQTLGHEPKVILSGRKINDGMGEHVALKLIDAMNKQEVTIEDSKILIMGFTFKENCPDIRNTKVVDVINKLKTYGCSIDVYDQWADREQSLNEYNIKLESKLEKYSYDAIILSVPHNDFIDMGIEKIKTYGNENCIFFDLKSVFSYKDSDLRL